jgi:molybdopterin-binding protein
MISVRALSARAGEFTLRDITFEVPRGKYGVVIGPAGSGKTTLLEVIAGLIAHDAGTLIVDDRDAAGVPPESRGIGLVHQHGYLFPHLSVAENIAYGASDPAFARAVAARVGADALAARDVRTLSGGERAVVAIARAIAARPPVLLLDEPFSTLDPRRRAVVRREVRALHRELGMTVLQVTHDFTEAGLLGDVAILLDAGRVLQSGPPNTVFRAPGSAYIAEFLGAENVFAGEVRVHDGEIEFATGPLTFYTVGDAHAGPGHAVIRAEEVTLSTGLGVSSARNRFHGRVTEIAALGALTRAVVDVDGVPLVAALTTRSAEDLALAEGQRVWVSFKAMAVHLC